jgi:hypothetical protein
MSTTTPVAYNPSLSPIAGTTQIGDLAVGTTDQDYSISPGGVTWWMGPDEDLGYVIAAPVSGGTQPTPIVGVFAYLGFYRTEDFTDTSFINLSEYVTNEYGNPQNFSSANEASNWLTTNGFWNSYINPVVFLDSGDPTSYPGSGSTWFDLTTGNNATLFNTPTYSPNFDGILQFSKTSLEYATIPNIGTIQNWTVEVWVRFTSSLNGQISMVVGNQFNLSSSINFVIGTGRAPTSYNIAAGFFQNGWYNTTGFAPTLNTWYQIVGTYDGSTIRQYVNGSASGGTLNVSSTLQSGGEVRIMRRWDDNLSSGNLFDGDLAIVKIYDKALNSTQINSIWNENKSRFGL